MALGINTNLGGLGALNNARKAAGVFSGAMEKLSSGLAVNRGADNPAALVISEMLRSQMGGITSALRNAQEAHNVAAIAEGGAGQVSDLMSRARPTAPPPTSSAGRSRPR